MTHHLACELRYGTGSQAAVDLLRALQHPLAVDDIAERADAVARALAVLARAIRTLVEDRDTLRGRDP